MLNQLLIFIHVISSVLKTGPDQPLDLLDRQLVTLLVWLIKQTVHRLDHRQIIQFPMKLTTIVWPKTCWFFHSIDTKASLSPTKLHGRFEPCVVDKMNLWPLYYTIILINITENIYMPLFQFLYYLNIIHFYIIRFNILIHLYLSLII